MACERGSLSLPLPPLSLSLSLSFSLSLSTNYKVVAWGKLSSLTLVYGLIRFDLKMSTSLLPHYLNYTPMSGTLHAFMTSSIKLWKHIMEYIATLNWIYIYIYIYIYIWEMFNQWNYSVIKIKWKAVVILTFRRLMLYIYGAPILDVSRSHTTTQHSR